MENEFKFNKEKLENAFIEFKKYSQEKRFKEDRIERNNRKVFFKEIIHEGIDELNFEHLIKKLWASKTWGNKDYLVSKIIKDNGIHKIRKELNFLIFNKTTTIGDRYERFLKEIKGMGPSMITEILCHIYPNDAGIWNDRARKSLTWLEVENVPYKKYKINSQEYNKFNEVLKKIAEILTGIGYKNVDLLFVDYFIWEVFNNFVKGFGTQTTIILKEDKTISRHDEIRDKLAQIGSWLGFEVETEKLIVRGSRVDTVWRARIANLGAVSYIFEVQDRGSIDGLIVNLQRSQTKSTVQKLIIVSDSEQMIKIKGAIEDLSENFRKAVVFWDIEDIENTYQNLEQVTESIEKLNLIED